MIQIVGGKLDGQCSPAQLLQIEEKGETYMLTEYSELVGDRKVRHQFYMLTGGPTVEEAVKIYKGRLKAA